MVAPLANGSNGRDLSGRFSKGNPGGPGNPLARRTAAVRRLFNESVGEDDLRAVVAELVARAKAGRKGRLACPPTRLLKKRTEYHRDGFRAEETG